MKDERTGHPSFGQLLEYWLHDTDEAATDTIDAHLLGCDACGALVDEIAALGEGVRAAFRAGQVATSTGVAFLHTLAARGLKLREYRVAPGGSVNCTIAPDDDLLVTRLEAPLQGVTRLDLRVRLSHAPDTPLEWTDIPFDPAAGEVLHLPKPAEVRRMPAHSAEMTLLAVDARGGSRELGRYHFHHRPWAER